MATTTTTTTSAMAGGSDDPLTWTHQTAEGREEAVAGLPWFLSLSRELKTACLLKMEAVQVASFAQVSHECAALVADDALWRNLTARDFQQLDDASSKVVNWRAEYRKRHMMHELKVVQWERLLMDRGQTRPCAREGHTFAALPGGTGAVVFGGWGGAIRNDVLRLDCGGIAEGGKPSWTVVNAKRGASTIPHVRYGHSLTACGADLLVAFGGMTSGGYRGVLGDVVALRAREGGEPGDLQFFTPTCKGPSPKPRGYHSACASPDGSKLYIFGGISQSNACNELAILDTATWSWSLPATEGEPPSPRFGCATALYKGKLWVVGGGQGGDLLRSGDDLHDVHCLDVDTLTWSQPELAGQPPSQSVMGRESGYALVGSKLLLFGGSLDFHNKLTYIDLEERRWGVPRVLGVLPPGRITGRMALVGDSLYMFGGWHPLRSEVGDLHRLRLAPEEDALSTAGAAQAGIGESLEERLMNLRREYQRMMMHMAMLFMTGTNEIAGNLVEQAEEVAEQIANVSQELKDLGMMADSEEEDAGDDNDDDEHSEWELENESDEMDEDDSSGDGSSSGGSDVELGVEGDQGIGDMDDIDD